MSKAEWVDNKWNLYGVREFSKVGKEVVENFYEILDGKGIVNLEPEYIKIVMLSSKTLNFQNLLAGLNLLR